MLDEVFESSFWRFESGRGFESGLALILDIIFLADENGKTLSFEMEFSLGSILDGVLVGPKYLLFKVWVESGNIKSNQISFLNLFKI